MPAKRTRADRAGLSREKVLDAALALADRDGIAALSMRRLGAELGVEAMTLYHYVPNKDALLDGMVERVLAETSALRPTREWSRALSDYARALRETLLRHPGVLELAATRPAVTVATLRTVESGLQLLREAGFALGRALDALNALSVFVIAHVTAEIRTAPVNAAHSPGSVAYLAALDPAEFPLLHAAAATGEGVDDAQRFEFAVRVFVSGLAAYVHGPDHDDHR